MDYLSKLSAQWDKKKNICVGLDPDISKLPQVILQAHSTVSDQIFAFNKAIVDSTYSLVACYKPNSAFYEAHGVEGIEALRRTIEYIHVVSQEIEVLLDFKRADIGNTNQGYVQFAYEYLQADSVTVHPYLGKEALEPFLKRRDKGVYVLCRTSNPGAGEFQDLKVGKNPLYQRVAEEVSSYWNEENNVGLVVGATYPEELAAVREIDDQMPILIPGIGAQGGDLKRAVKAVKNNFLISSSRGIIYASGGENFAEAARSEVEKLQTQIRSVLSS